MFSRMFSTVPFYYFALMVASTSKFILTMMIIEPNYFHAGQNESCVSIRHNSVMYCDKNEEPVQFDFTAWNQPAGFSPILSDTCHPGFMAKHCACNLVENATESWIPSIPTLNTPASMAENYNINNNLEVSHELYLNDSLCHFCDAFIFEYSAKITGPNVRETHDISHGGDTFSHTLIFQLIIVLLVISLVVFYFLHFKRSSKAKSTIDPEFQDLVIKYQTFTSDDTDPHINANCEKEKAQTLTATTNSVPDKQIQAKLPDVINSRE